MNKSLVLVQILKGCSESQLNPGSHLVTDIFLDVLVIKAKGGNR